ncbi:hypothetical protein XENTR_v10005781 [Xenopus tropicalis]|uniref:CD164 sialomucin-like 2 protein isoform X2 n=1 Tax=Xenopus tropicalis TaxID=8364 RepID=A0A8J0SYV2_XENTR|eukprot:XP_017947376.1 PREDICTED: CD164 sialomucin-like 2 protein isoform X2 [Xenopus tropicalis]
MKQLFYVAILSSALCLCCAGSCRQLETCVHCTTSTLNTSCEWITCRNSANSSCVHHGTELGESCFATNTSSMCAGETLHTKHVEHTETEDTAQNEEDSAQPEQHSEHNRLTQEQSDDAPSADSSHTVFHVGSFIGGGVLVIILQAIGFIVVKRLRGTQSDYQAMEETPQ